MAQTLQEAATPAGTAANSNLTTPSKSAATPASPTSDKASLLTLPLARVKRMIKEEDDVAPAHHEAEFLIARATELFIDGLSSRATAGITEAGKGFTYCHVAQAVGAWGPCDFLQGMHGAVLRFSTLHTAPSVNTTDVVPKKITAWELLTAMNARKASQAR